MSIFANIVNVVRDVVEGIITKMSFTDIVFKLLSYVPALVKDLTKFFDMRKDGYTPEEKKAIIDSGLQEFDNITGAEGIRVIEIIPTVGGEEQTLDLFKYFLRNILYAKFDIQIPRQIITIGFPGVEPSRTKTVISRR